MSLCYNALSLLLLYKNLAPAPTYSGSSAVQSRVSRQNLIQLHRPHRLLHVNLLRHLVTKSGSPKPQPPHSPILIPVPFKPGFAAKTLSSLIARTACCVSIWFACSAASSRRALPRTRGRDLKV
jgi:hypothetical protein